MKKKKPRILLLIDKPNWAFDICASEYIKYLSDDFIFTKKYLVRPRPFLLSFKYDLIHVFWWGETYYKRFHWPKSKILKEVSSHRWEDDPRYGPCTPEEFAKKYLADSGTVVCTSNKLYSKIKPFFPRIHLANNGYSPQVFFLQRKNTQRELTLCWVGNANDSVKGINDILIPAATALNLRVDIATNLPHDELRGFYNDHDIILVGSIHEASPLTLIEAMACGCFPVCTDVGIVSELVVHGRNGYIVENRSVDSFIKAFKWCSENIDFVREQGIKNAALVYEKRRWEVCAESFRLMYKEALLP
jgi:glycosyltransferase involved in cell wall biosynthesis